MMETKGKIAVVGAGMSGLACAYELTQAGFEVTVYEKGDSVGGRAGTRRKGHYPFDLGAQFLNNGYRLAQDYCNKLGLANKWGELKPSTHHLLNDGELHNISFTSVRELLNMRLYSPSARLRLFVLYLKMFRDSRGLNLYDLSANDDKWNNETAHDYCKRWGGNEVLNKAIDALVATYHFHGPEELSASVLLAACAGVGADFSYDFTTGGIDALARALSKSVCVNKDSEVHEVNSLGDEVAVVSSEGTAVYDWAVVATTPSAAQKIYTNPSSKQGKLLDQVRYASSINAGFWAPQEAIKHLAMVAVPKNQNERVCCYFNQHSKYSECLRDGQTLVNTFYRDETAKEMMNASDEDVWEDMKLNLLEVCPPLRPHANALGRYDLQRWPEAIPKYTPAYIDAVKRFWNVGQGDKNVFLCGDYLNAPWMEGSLRCGKKVAHAVVSAAQDAALTV